jgi:putative endonuclease
MRTREFLVYILASRSRTLYVGVTHHLGRRLAGHREGTASRCTKKDRVRQLVCFERYGFVGDAQRRERQLKGWTRAKKIALIEAANPAWRDLAADPLPDPSLRSG